MSVKVELSELGEAMGRHDYAFLVCLGEERPHVLGVRPRLVGDRLRVHRIGATATRVVGEHGGVTLVFPPREAGGRSLLVDGTVAEIGDGELVVTPVGAVLHRPA
jgi:hypothetical protein